MQIVISYFLTKLEFPTCPTGHSRSSVRSFVHRACKRCGRLGSGHYPLILDRLLFLMFYLLISVSRCAGCGRFVGGDSGEIASDEHSLLWHPPCFRTLHPDVSLLSEESVVTRLPAPTASSPTRPPILASPDAPPSRRRRSLWLTGVSAANMTAAVGGEPPRTAERPQDVGARPPSMCCGAYVVVRHRNFV